MLKNKLKQNPATCHPEKSVYARGLCTNCYYRWMRENKPEYAERQRENQRKWVESHMEQKKKIDKDYRLKQSPEYSHIKKLRKYGMTPGEYDILLKRQNGVCAICGKPPKPKKKLHVDHDHMNGKVRGLLCFRCNFGLSYFSENHKIVHKAFEYLSKADNVGKLLNKHKTRRKEREKKQDDKFKEVLNESHTKEIIPEILEKMKILKKDGLSIAKIHKQFPQYSRSAIWRSVNNKTRKVKDAVHSES